MRWVNSRVIPARGASAGTEPPYGVGLRDGLYGQAGVALAFEMREMPPPCVQSHGGIAERSRMPLHELQAVYNLRASKGREMFNCFNNDRHGQAVRNGDAATDAGAWRPRPTAVTTAVPVAKRPARRRSVRGPFIDGGCPCLPADPATRATLDGDTMSGRGRARYHGRGRDHSRCRSGPA